MNCIKNEFYEINYESDYQNLNNAFKTLQKPNLQYFLNTVTVNTQDIRL